MARSRRPTSSMPSGNALYHSGAVVADQSAFETETGELVDLALQIFGEDGLLQVMVTMERTLIQK